MREEPGRRGSSLPSEVRELACGAPSGPVNPARLEAGSRRWLNLQPQRLGLGGFLLSRDTWICGSWASQMELEGCGCPHYAPVQLYRSRNVAHLHPLMIQGGVEVEAAGSS